MVSYPETDGSSLLALARKISKKFFLSFFLFSPSWLHSILGQSPWPGSYGKLTDPVCVRDSCDGGCSCHKKDRAGK